MPGMGENIQLIVADRGEYTRGDRIRRPGAIAPALADAGANIARHNTLTLTLSGLSCAALA